MAAFTTNTPVRSTRPSRPTLFERFDAFFTDLARARACADEFQHLWDLSDAQLAERGLKRSDIVQHVGRAYL